MTFDRSPVHPGWSLAALLQIAGCANHDLRPHRLILDDGTPTGVMIADPQPGGTSVPFPLNTSPVHYHCELHPSMVGSITALPLDTAPGAPGVAPADPAAPASPVDPAYPAGPDSGYSLYRLR